MYDSIAYTEYIETIHFSNAIELRLQTRRMPLETF